MLEEGIGKGGDGEIERKVHRQAEGKFKIGDYEIRRKGLGDKVRRKGGDGWEGKKDPKRNYTYF